MGWASSSEATTRVTHCLQKLVRIFVQYNPPREEKTFNLSPTQRKQARSQVSIWDWKRKWYDLLGMELYAVWGSFKNGFAWHQAHASLKFPKETQALGLAFRYLIINMNFKSSRFRKFHRVCILHPIHSTVKGTASTTGIHEVQKNSGKNKTIIKVPNSYFRIPFI